MKNLWFIAVGISMLVFAGCASPAGAPDSGSREKEYEIAMGERIIKAFDNGDIKAFSQELPPDIRSNYGKKEFEAERKVVAERWGEIESFRYLTQLEMEPLHQHVWAVRFKRKSLNGPMVFQEVLFAVLTGKIDGQSKVFLFGFK